MTTALVAGSDWLRPRAEAAVNGALAVVGRARAMTGPTSRWQRPSFVIVGAQRCGTTSMYHYLTAHPQVCAALTKEVHYFDVNYDRGPDWYAAHFITRHRAQLRSRSLGRRVVTGEASPYYMYHPHALRRMHELLPDVKVVVMLRDPAQRAVSHYSHERAKGFETAELPDALRMEDTRLAGEEEKLASDPSYRSFAHQHYSYLGRGNYLPQLQRLHEFYPAEQVFIVNSNDFYREPDTTYHALLEFLELDGHTLPTYKQHNTYVSAKPDEATRARLVRHFAPLNAALYEYVGRDFGWAR